MNGFKPDGKYALTLNGLGTDRERIQNGRKVRTDLEQIRNGS